MFTIELKYLFWERETNEGQKRRRGKKNNEFTMSIDVLANMVNFIFFNSFLNGYWDTNLSTPLNCFVGLWWPTQAINYSTKLLCTSNQLLNILTSRKKNVLDSRQMDLGWSEFDTFFFLFNFCPYYLHWLVISWVCSLFFLLLYWEEFGSDTATQAKDETQRKKNNRRTKKPTNNRVEHTPKTPTAAAINK